jgi:adenylate cyclase
MFKINSLQKRLVIFLILPVVILLISTELMGFFYIRKKLLEEWQDSAILRLERAAHQIDMRLQLVTRWLGFFAKTGSGPQAFEIQEWLLKQLREQEGVSQVKLIWLKSAAEDSKPHQKGDSSSRKIERVSSPQYFYPEGGDLVGVRSELLAPNGEPLGQIEATIRFDYLMEKALTSGWMQSQMACLLNVKSGLYLAHSDPTMKNRHCLAETQDPLEVALVEAMKEKPYGVLRGPGHPPEHVIGFYRLQAAPWAIMLHAKGSEILAPIVRFRFYYLGAGILCLAIILVLIRQGVSSLASAIRTISQRAALVAQGEYGEPLPVTSQDEIGQLTQSFNEMVAGLKERDFIRNTFGRYVDQEIARELLARPEAALLGGEKREVAILFSDIRGFTPLAETLTPEATIQLVNRYFSRMIKVIQQHRGIIVDFLGDAILAFFDPLDGPLTPVVRQAVKCGLKMQVALEEDNALQPKSLVLQMGVGLHVGEVVVGTIGSEDRAKYGIVGSAVNLTHRIQGQAKGGEVIISEPALQKAGPGLAVQKTFETRLKGIQEPVSLYVVEDIAEI